MKDLVLILWLLFKTCSINYFITFLPSCTFSFVTSSARISLALISIGIGIFKYPFLLFTCHFSHSLSSVCNLDTGTVCRCYGDNEITTYTNHIADYIQFFIILLHICEYLGWSGRFLPPVAFMISYLVCMYGK